MTTRLEICNGALARIAAGTFSTEDVPEAAPVLQIYDDMVSFLLALKRWRFATRTIQLARATAAAAGGFYLYQYALPGDRIGLPDAYYDRIDQAPGGTAFTDYELADGGVLTNAEVLWSTYRTRAEIALWPALFRECVTLLVAGEAAVTMHEDSGRRDRLRADVLGDPRVPGHMGLIAQAWKQDVQARPSRIIDAGGGALIDVRRLGRR